MSTVDAEDVEATLLRLDEARARRYIAGRERWIRERLPLYVQSEFGVAVLRDMHAVLEKVLGVAPKTRTRLKWCSSACCAGKPKTERHGPYAVTEWWDTSGPRGVWRTVPKGLRTPTTASIEAALAPEPPAPPRDVDEPRRATDTESEALRNFLV